jgi:antitoxin (DNA-binding transcriptional repressor) of toxin-antitoxin stability system
MRLLLEQTDKSLAEVASIAASGEDVLLINEGRIVARVIGNDEPSVRQPDASKRKFGFLKSHGFRVPHDIKTPFQHDIEEMFYGDADKR